MAHVAFAARRVKVRFCTTLLLSTKPTLKRTINRASNQFHGGGDSGGSGGPVLPLFLFRASEEQQKIPFGHRLVLRLFFTVLAATYYKKRESYEENRQLDEKKLQDEKRCQDLANPEAVKLRRDLSDYELYNAAISCLDDKTVAELQRDIHAVLSADPAVMAEIGTNLKIYRPYYADLRYRPYYALMKFPCSGTRNRCTILAHMWVPRPSARGPYDHAVLTEGFRDAIATQPDRHYSGDIPIPMSGCQRPMKTKSRFDLLVLDTGESKVCLCYRKDVEKSNLLKCAEESQHEDSPEESERNGS